MDLGIESYEHLWIALGVFIWRIGNYDLIIVLYETGKRIRSFYL